MAKFFFLVIMVFALGCNQQNRHPYLITPEETLSTIQEGDFSLSMAEAKTLMENQEVHWIDLRSEMDFEGGHIPNARHIQTHNILDPAFSSLWEAPSAKILYARNLAEANGPWMLLTQLGYKNIYLFEEGFPANSNEDIRLDDVAKYDFNKVLNEVTEQNRKEEEASKPKAAPRPVVRVVPKKKKKVVKEEEGC
jgi:rhodanese-related sulfurtransferase